MGPETYGAVSLEDARTLPRALNSVIVHCELSDGDGLDLIYPAAAVGSRLMVISKNDRAAERIKAFTLGVHIGESRSVASN